MPIQFDHTGQLHSGSIGLFDCDYEYQRTHAVTINPDGTQESYANSKPKPKKPSLPKRIWYKVTRKNKAPRGFEILEPPKRPEKQVQVQKKVEEQPEKTYPRSAVDPEESPWLEACGMVRVREEGMGWQIVPLSSIRED